MPRAKSLFIPVLALLFALITPREVNGQADSARVKSTRILQMASLLHFSPPAIDSTFSEHTFQNFMSSLGGGSFFTANDVNKLKPYSSTAGNGGDDAAELVDATAEVYKNRLVQLKKVIIEISQSTLDFSVEESITFPEEDEWLSDEDWEAYWKSYYKLRVLLAVYAHRDTVSTSFQPAASLVSEWQSKIGQRIVCKIENDISTYGEVETMVCDHYLKALASTLDPHTSYFTEFDLKQFTESLSKNSLSFGFEVYRNDDGDLEVYNVTPGGAAWNSNSINEGDILIEAKSRTQTTDDFHCLTTTEIAQILDMGDETKGSFTLRKQSGEEVQVSLTKTVVAVSENVIQSYILEGEHKLGYIYLPSFYESGDESDPYGCAQDVTNAVIRLKRQGVDGLIFDVRNNGGGSMSQAIKLAGSFVDRGALSIFSYGEPPYETLKDMNRGMVFDKPMIVLVNAFSASASELFAAAMQDHNRAIIVGSTTFGKATAQNILPMLHMEGGDTSIVGTDMIKITTGGFYRVTGETHQNVGVIPDISLPEAFDYTDYKESSLPNALPATTIQKRTYYTPRPALPIEELSAQSASRINADSTWRQIVALGETDQNDIENFEIPLSADGFSAFMQIESEEDSLLNHEMDTPYSIKTLRYLLKAANGISEDDEQTTERLSRDIYVKESYLILNDYIHILEQ